MYYFIFLFLTLSLDIFSYRIFISKLTYCIDKISIRPNLSSPQLLFYFRMFLKYFSCCYTFYNRYYLCLTQLGYRLNQKMYMISVCSYLHKSYFVTQRYFKTNCFQTHVNFFGKDNSPIFCRTYKMINQN